MFFNQSIKTQPKDELVELAVDLKASQHNKNLSCRFGQWTTKETLKHYLFIYHHREKFQSKSMRKSLRVFKLMSQFIKTRNPGQCRTHHQKIMKNEISLSSCIQSYIKEHPSFLTQYERVKKTLDLLEDNDFCEDGIYERKEFIFQDWYKEKDEDNAVKKEEMQSEKEEEKMLYPTMPYEIQQKPVYGELYMECQQLFIKWVTKLNQIMQRANQQ